MSGRNGRSSNQSIRHRASGTSRTGNLRNVKDPACALVHGRTLLTSARAIEVYSGEVHRIPRATGAATPPRKSRQAALPQTRTSESGCRDRESTSGGFLFFPGLAFSWPLLLLNFALLKGNRGANHAQVFTQAISC